jgi:hypothetical protein
VVSLKDLKSEIESEVDAALVDRQKIGEVRVISTLTHGISQWVVLTFHSISDSFSTRFRGSFGSENFSSYQQAGPRCEAK